ncbi:hypothetical protein E4T47_07934 [Aureobasidium subglaciale]|nr:hypothetical protein E4T47_07934 [Aureobasidium subglaciale]
MLLGRALRQKDADLDVTRFASIEITPCPIVSSPRYSHIFKLHQTLIRLLDAHPAMKENRNQTYSTPAISKNNNTDVITKGGISSPAPLEPFKNATARNPNCRDNSWKDVILRCVLAKELILDKTGKLEQMNRDTGYNDDAGIDFGEEIETEALKLDEKFNAEERGLIELLRTKIPSGKIMDALGS